MRCDSAWITEVVRLASVASSERTATTAMQRACLPILLFACVADARSPDPHASGDPPAPASQNMHTVTLTASSPGQDVALSPQPAAPSTLVLTITGVEDPSSQAYVIGASVVWNAASGGGPIVQPLGNVTPYPPSRPGRFVIGVPEAARQLLARRGGALSLRLALQPVAADRPLAEPLRVTLADPAWP
jgi:hypothetical protein